MTWDEEERTFSLNLAEEHFIDVSTAIASVYSSANDFTDYTNYDQGRIAFSDGRALYYSRLLGDFRQLREVEDDYGVVCFPRYSYDSSESSFFVQNPTTLFLPLVIGDDNGDRWPDFDEIGIFLEAVGAYTYDDTLSVYIENAVIGKGMRDERSADMVRLMMKNRSFDLGEAFSLHDVMDIYRLAVIKGEGLASSEQKALKMFTKMTEKIVKKIKEFDAGN